MPEVNKDGGKNGIQSLGNHYAKNAFAKDRINEPDGGGSARDSESSVPCPFDSQSSLGEDQEDQCRFEDDNVAMYVR